MKGLLVVGVLAGLGVGGYFIYRKVKTPDNTGSKVGQKKGGTGAKANGPPNAPASAPWYAQVPWGQVATAGVAIAKGASSSSGEDDSEEESE